MRLSIYGFLQGFPGRRVRCECYASRGVQRAPALSPERLARSGERHRRGLIDPGYRLAAFSCSSPSASRCWLSEYIASRRFEMTKEEM
jgi:hypothetical protein